MKTSLAILIAALSMFAASAKDLTFTWDLSAGATSYGIYQSVGTGPFNAIANVQGPPITVTGVSTQIVTRWFVRSANSAGEAAPSNVVTNNLLFVLWDPERFDQSTRGDHGDTLENLAKEYLK